jgi:hypothetical protein
MFPNNSARLASSLTGLSMKLLLVGTLIAAAQAVAFENYPAQDTCSSVESPVIGFDGSIACFDAEGLGWQVILDQEMDPYLVPTAPSDYNVPSWQLVFDKNMTPYLLPVSGIEGVGKGVVLGQEMDPYRVPVETEPIGQTIDPRAMFADASISWQVVRDQEMDPYYAPVQDGFPLTWGLVLDRNMDPYFMRTDGPAAGDRIILGQEMDPYMSPIRDLTRFGWEVILDQEMDPWLRPVDSQPAKTESGFVDERTFSLER